jgi:hypothetical protein
VCDVMVFDMYVFIVALLPIAKIGVITLFSDFGARHHVQLFFLDIGLAFR